MSRSRCRRSLRSSRAGSTRGSTTSATSSSSRRSSPTISPSIAHAIGRYGLPANLKLSVHSGSDKFSIYAPIRRSIAKFGAGLHLKTAGTTWLEEVIGLAEAGGDGLGIAKEIYAKAVEKRDALCAPYAAVIDIDPREAAESSGCGRRGRRPSSSRRCGTIRSARSSIRRCGN